MLDNLLLQHKSDLMRIYLQNGMSFIESQATEENISDFGRNILANIVSNRFNK